jgi:hypothetical protein
MLSWGGKNNSKAEVIAEFGVTRWRKSGYSRRKMPELNQLGEPSWKRRTLRCMLIAIIMASILSSAILADSF